MNRKFIERFREYKYKREEHADPWVFVDNYESSSDVIGAQNGHIGSACFINGCSYKVPHPVRYRVDHQCEQLRFAGTKAIKLDEWDMSLGDLKKADCDLLIIFRAPMTVRLNKAIEWARLNGKCILFDIDDLVVDECYTSEIQYVKNLSRAQRQRYDRGVALLKETMLCCDGILTSTTGMAHELKNYNEKIIVNRNVASSEMVYWSDMALAQKNEHEEVRLGYFSGSITHNEDISLILPELVKVLDERKETTLSLVGQLDLPKELLPYRSRIISMPFVSWRELPFLLASVDINLAPLVDTVFNRAKSENKWMEAALVKVPTIASSVGAFEEMIIDGQTGALCINPDEWYKTLIEYITDRSLRERVGKQARDYCLTHCTTRQTASSFERKLMC